MSPGILGTILQLASIASFYVLLIPYMHHSRMRMSAECETCKSNALVEYKNNLSQCEVVAGAIFNPQDGTFGLKWLEVFGIVCLSCTWQCLIWLLWDKLSSRLFYPDCEKDV